MIIEQHYDEEVLIALLDEQTPDPHLQSCETCKASLNSIRRVTTALHDPAVWDRRELHEEPRPETRSALVSIAISAAAEDATAGPWVKALLAKPASEWRAMVDAHPEWRTAGFARGVIKAVDSINFTAPTDAVELTKIAVEVVEQVGESSDRFTKLKAAAWREYGYALNYVGSHIESIRAYEHCYTLLQQAKLNEYDIARVQLYHAQPLSSMERHNDALTLARAARKTFAEFGDRRRVTIAIITEGTILLDAHRYVEALPLQMSVMDDPAVDELSRACAAHNAAVCRLEMNDLTEAKRLFVHAVAAYERLGVPAFHAKARWSFAAILVREQQYAAAMDVFQSVRSEMEELGIAHSVALVYVDMAETLLLDGKSHEVSTLCNSAMSYFREAKLTYTEGALTALAFLREAADAKALTVSELKEVRAFFEILPQQPELLFARPA